MTTSLKTFSLSIALIVLLILYNSMYTVQEGERGILLRLGEIVLNDQGKATVLTPGVGFKTPILNQVRLFDARLQTLSVQSSRIFTKDQKNVIVDYYIKWRIEDLPLYYQRTGGDRLRAETLLQQQVNDALRAEFGQRTITEMLADERINVMVTLKNSANSTAKNLGINVTDVRIKTIDLPEVVSSNVFENMRTAREQDATQSRADGRAEAEAKEAAADASAAIMVSEAKTKAATMRAQATADAARIYAEAYGKDPEFYAFYKSLETYKTVFSNKSDVLLLTPDSDFFKYFNSPLAGKSAINGKSSG